MKTNNSTTTNSHSPIENGCFTSKSSRTVKIRSVITGTAAWLAICAILLIWHELNVEFITEMCSCLVAGAIVTTASLSTTIYPDNTDKITDFMKSRNIEVR